MIFCFHKYLFRFFKNGDQKKKEKGGGSKKERANFEMSDNFFNVQKIRQKIY